MMQSFFSGPHGAEEEPHSDFWANMPEAGDVLPGTLPGDTANGQTAGNSAADEELYHQAVTRRATDPSNAAEGRGSLDESDPDADSAENETEDSENESDEAFEDEEESEGETEESESEAENEESGSENGDDAGETTAEGIADPAEQASPQDPLGSWTGVPDLDMPNVEEIPTQDQDDL